MPHSVPHLESIEKAIKDDTHAQEKRALEAQLRIATQQAETQRLQNQMLVMERKREQELRDLAKLVKAVDALSVGAINLFSLFNN